MKSYTCIGSLLVLLLLFPSLYAQDSSSTPGVIIIRKKVNEKSKRGIYIGLHGGFSSTTNSFNHSREDISQRYFYSDEVFGSWNPDYLSTTGSRTYKFGNAQDIIPNSSVFPKNYFIGSYVIVPINKFIALVPEVSLNSNVYFSTSNTRRGYLVSTDERVEYVTKYKYQNLQLQLILKVEGHVTIGRFTPFMRVGTGGLINVRTRKYVEVEPITAPPDFLYELMFFGYETSSKTEAIERGNAIPGVVLNPGFRIRISDRFNASVDYQYTQAVGTVARIEVQNGEDRSFNYGTNSLAVGLEMKLGQ